MDGFFGKRQRLRPTLNHSSGRGGFQRIGPHGLIKSFDALLTKVRVGERHSLTNERVDSLREAHASGLCQAFEARGDIHAVSEEVSAANRYIAQVDADPKLKTPIRRCIGNDLPKPLLDHHRALNGIYSAREFREHTVARRVRDSSPVLRNKSVHNLASGS
jgi:hypothetical protein